MIVVGERNQAESWTKKPVPPAMALSGTTKVW